MAQQGLQRKLEEQLQCSICLENFKGKDPRGLPCLHSFCKDCLQKLPQDGDKITCPLCRKQCTIPPGGVNDIPISFAVNMMLELNDCIEQQSVAENNIPLCTSHGKVREYYCRDCDAVICSDCMIDDHQGSDHYCRKAEVFYDAKKEEIQQALNLVCRYIAEVEGVADGFDEELREASKQVTEIQTEIDRFIFELHRRLDIAKEQLMNKVEILHKQIAESKKQKQESAQNMLFQLKSCRDFVESELNSGSKTQVLAVNRRMTSYMSATVMHVDRNVFKRNDVSLYFDAARGICENVGSVFHVCCDECRVTNNRFVATCNHSVSFNIIVPRKTKLPHHCFVVCRPLESPHTTVKGAMVKLNDECYKFRMFPDVLGPHEVNVQIGSKMFKGCPFMFKVFPPKLIGQKPLRTLKNFISPLAIAVRDDHVIVGDMVPNADCITVLDGQGQTVQSFGRIDDNFRSISDMVLAEDGGCYVLDSISSSLYKFSSLGHFENATRLQRDIRHPVCLAVKNGRVFIGDLGNAAVHVLNADLTYVTSFGGRGLIEDKFVFIKDIAVDSKGNIFVSDFKKNKVVKFSLNMQSGEYCFCSILSIERPTYLCIDKQDTLYVMNQKVGRGYHKHYLSMFDCSESVECNSFVNLKSYKVSNCRGHGKAYCQNRMAIDERGYLYICNPSDGTVTIH